MLKVDIHDMFFISRTRAKQKNYTVARKKKVLGI